MSLHGMHMVVSWLDLMGLLGVLHLPARLPRLLKKNDAPAGQLSRRC
jgi:hypothetical protein